VPADTEYIWNIRAYAALIDHAHALIDSTQERLLVAIGRQEAATLVAPLARAVPAPYISFICAASHSSLFLRSGYL
jgi:hypothetical protein